MVLRNLRIGMRLALGFGAVVAILMVLALGGTLLENRSRNELAAIMEHASAKEAVASRMKALALQQSATIRNIGLHSDVKSMNLDEDRARKMGGALDETREKMAGMVTTAAEREVLDAIDRADKSLDTPLKTAMAFSTALRTEEAAQLILAEIDPVIARMLADIDRLADMQRKSSAEAVEAARVAGDRLANGIYAAALLTMLLSVVIAWAVTRSITLPLDEAVSIAQRVAAGDLSAQVRVSGRDEAAHLLKALRDMNEGLGAMVMQIRTGAESIAVGAGQVAAGNQQLSSRTEEHASSLEETASTLEEFTTTVKQNAEHAQQASQLAGTASLTAEKGGEVVGRVVTTMQEVTASSKRISDIIGVIDGISFQTNILALNAAVEAARAGEQGRGFAVVASEVRSLAQRSAASAKEIRGLIESSVARVEAGARLVEQAGHTMDDLVASVRKVAQIMTDIAAASHQQSSGIEQINKAITQMDTVVQMNASLVEEATAAATSMATQAEGLTHAVSQFRLEGQSMGAAFDALEPRIAATAPAPALRAARPAAPPKAAPAPARRETALAAHDDEEWKEF